MSKVNLFREPDGWRATIKHRGRTVVVDGFFEDEIDAAFAAAETSSRINQKR